jgi:hypothetical protein
VATGGYVFKDTTPGSSTTTIPGTNTVSPGSGSAGSIQIVTLTEWCSSNLNSGIACAAGTKMCFSISGFDNPSTTEVPTLSVTIRMNTGSGDIVDALTTGIVILPYVNKGPLQALVITRSPNVVGDPTTITINFKTTTVLGSNGYIYVNFPATFLYIATGSPVCKIGLKGTTLSTTNCNPSSTNDLKK